MKTYYFAIFMLTYFSIYAQIELPHKIIIQYYEGGDYRKDEIKGSYSYKDSLVYTLSKTKKYVGASRIAQFDIYDFIGKYAEVAKKMVHIKELSRKKNKHKKKPIATKDILDLMALSKQSIYHVIADTLEIDTTDIGINYTMSGLPYRIPKDFSYSYYDLDSTKFNCRCEAYKKKMKIEKSCEPLDSLFLYKLLGSDKGMIRFISSYMSYIEVVMYFDKETLTFIQREPCQQNIKWQIAADEKQMNDVYNPKINDIVAKIVPKTFPKRTCLQDYKDKKAIFDIYFN